jgi:hypothetical protein
MAYDVLAEHATEEERHALIGRFRGTLLAIGILCGFLGAAPSVIWASGAFFIVMAPLLVPLAIWIYTLVFAFSALWFSHYALTALQALRREREAKRDSTGDGFVLPEYGDDSSSLFLDTP